MKILLRRLFVLVSVLELFTLPTAWASNKSGGKSGKLSVELLGAGTMSMPKSTSAVSGGMGFPGGGLIFNYKLGAHVSFEFGALYLNTMINNGEIQTITLVQGLGGLKFTIGKSFFIDAGGYGNNHLKDTMTVSGRAGGGYGGLGVQIFPTSSMSLILRVQYDVALTSLLDIHGDMVTPSQMVGMLGVSFPIKGGSGSKKGSKSSASGVGGRPR